MKNMKNFWKKEIYEQQFKENWSKLRKIIKH